MSFPMRALIASVMLAVAHAQGVLVSAKGPKGPASLGLQVDPTKSDANIINLKEIKQNAVNECGRTILGGNIDIGENTENQLLNKTVTQVTKGAKVDVTIRQVSADGVGPYSCDLDLTSNANGATGQIPLQVTESQPQNGNINLKVTMPADMECVGASTGNVCTVRCFNNNQKGPFGGCFAVQQTDVKPKENTPENIPTKQTLENVLTQVQQNTVDLPAAVKSNQESKTPEEQGVNAIKEILGSQATLEAAGPAGVGNTGGNTGGNKGGTIGGTPAGTPAGKTGGKTGGNNNTGKTQGNRGKNQGKNRGKAGGNANIIGNLLGQGGGQGRGQGQGRGGKTQQKNNKRDVLRSRVARHLAPDA
ncbi:hypothetical protein CCHL11_10233 [Colletotrichum chlorophyti]|uniref:GEgh16 protein n=1 Tax=Colletotrichum chlorophyti TaxID=708187 RepID=A0A1Q8RL45_9PEZI|nr:hypothetical protein CCHL11_10233 [Colletotrichum chlorophyti]